MRCPDPIAEDIAELAREAFNRYAGMDAPHLPDDPLSALQVRLVRWEVRQYGASTLDDAVEGATEEWNREYTEAVEKCNEAGKRDAAGDLGVFLVQILTILRLDYAAIRRRVAVPRGPWSDLEMLAAERMVSKGVGMLAEVARKTRQRFRGGWSRDRARAQATDAAGFILIGLLILHEDFDAILVETAEHVMRRVNPEAA